MDPSESDHVAALVGRRQRAPRAGDRGFLENLRRYRDGRELLHEVLLADLPAQPTVWHVENVGGASASERRLVLSAPGAERANAENGGAASRTAAHC